MDPIISRLLDDLPDKPPRSKLEPHVEVIAALRRKRHTYREIAEFFREHLSITVSPSTIHDFVRVRRGRGKRNVGSAHGGVPTDPKPLPRLKVTKNPSAADEAARQRIAALKRRTPLKNLGLSSSTKKMSRSNCNERHRRPRPTEAISKYFRCPRPKSPS